jgi:hypothetical protein
MRQIGPGTVVGDLMRQYWIPAALSSELARDGAPIRLMLLGEKLIAFRDSAGDVGVMDHRCPHRCASLFLGRNEDDPLHLSRLEIRFRRKLHRAGAVAGWDLHPLESAALSRRTPNSDI